MMLLLLLVRSVVVAIAWMATVAILRWHLVVVIVPVRIVATTAPVVRLLHILVSLIGLIWVIWRLFRVNLLLLPLWC